MKLVHLGKKKQRLKSKRIKNRTLGVKDEEKIYNHIKYEGLSFCTKGNVDPSGKINVFFCSDLRDCSCYFEQVKNEIWRMFPEVAIWNYDEREEITSLQLLLQDVCKMSLIIVPITKNFIEGNSIAKTLILPYVIEHHVSVLPLMLEKSVENEFNNICNNLQYLSKLEIPDRYNVELRKYLESTFNDEESELEKQIDMEFSLRLFISYRKIDKIYVEQIQEKIYNDNKLRDIAVLYDDYLVPGECFDIGLENMIKQCDVFILLVTPNIWKENNYVLTKEYPLALKKHKKIIPIQMLATDTEKMKKYFKRVVKDIISFSEISSFSNVLQKQKIYIPELNNNSKHLYLIGNAYLKGYKVPKKFDRAIGLIERAANKGYEAAYQKMILIYQNNYFMAKDRKKVIYWEEKYENWLINNDLMYPNKIVEHEKNIGDCYYELGQYKSALKTYEVMSELLSAFIKMNGNSINWSTDKKWKELSDIYLKMGQTYERMSLLEDAEKYLKKSVEIDFELDSNEETTSHTTMRSLAMSCNILAEFYLKYDKLIKAKHFFKHTVQLLDPSTHYMAWAAPNEKDVVHIGYSNLKAEEGDYTLLRDSYIALAEIALKRLQVNLAIKNFKSAQLYAYKLYKIISSRHEINIGIWVSLWYGCLKERDINLLEEEKRKEMLTFIENLVLREMIGCVSLQLDELEKYFVDLLEKLKFEDSKEYKFTQQDLINMMNKE